VSDLRKTQGEWTRLLGRELAGVYLSLLNELQELEARYAKERVRVLVLDEGLVGPKGLDLGGVEIGRNTHASGSLWASLSSSGVRLFQDKARQKQVAEGVGSGLVALKESNGSGLSGSWDLPAGAVGTARLLVVPDWSLRVEQTWRGDREARQIALDALSHVRDLISEAQDVIGAALSEWGEVQAARFLGSSPQALVRDTPLPDPAGAVSRAQSGVLVDLAKSMEDESLSGPQSVPQRRVVAASAVFGSRNVGRGQVPAFVPGEQCPEARWTLRCVSAEGGRERFAGLGVAADREISFEGVRVGYTFTGPEGFGPLRIDRSLVKKGDPQDRLLAPSGGARVSGEEGLNTDGGILHWRIRKNGSGQWAVSFFSSAARGSGDLVAEAENVTPSTSFRARERGLAGGLTVLWELGPAPQHEAEGTLDLGFFAVGDELVIETRVQTEGLLQALLAQHTGGVLRGGPAPTVPDAWARSGVLSSLLHGGTT